MVVYLLQKVTAAKWLGLNVTLWGIMTACTARRAELRRPPRRAHLAGRL
jgi:hypothetical protein